MSPTPPGSGYTPRDSARAERLPAPPRDVAESLIKEFVAAINTRTYSRITSAYSQPSTTDEIALWQSFLVFVRDYTPRAFVRSTKVDTSVNPPLITAVIDFRWSSDAGFERSRSGTFVGVGVPITGGWQLLRARLDRRFW